MQRGSLLHRVLEKFIRRHLGEKLQQAQYAELQKELDEIFDAVCQEYADKGWLYPGDFWQHDKEQQRILLQRWLRSEIAYSEQGEWRPVSTEQVFGKKGKGEVALDINGRRIYLNGKIDRIDRAGETYFITDYKSGDTPQKKAFADTDLQLPLYLLAAAMQTKGEVAGGGYYSLKDAERKESFIFPAAAGTVPWKTFSEAKDANGTATAITDMEELQATLQRVLGDMLEHMGEGDFCPTPSKDCENNCPAAEICRFRVLTRNREEEDPNG
jgi:RecB family exonuclease